MIPCFHRECKDYTVPVLFSNPAFFYFGRQLWLGANTPAESELPMRHFAHAIQFLAGFDHDNFGQSFAVLTW